MATPEAFVEDLGVTAVNAAQVEETLLQKVGPCELLHAHWLNAEGCCKCLAIGNLTAVSSADVGTGRDTSKLWRSTKWVIAAHNRQ